MTLEFEIVQERLWYREKQVVQCKPVPMYFEQKQKRPSGILCRTGRLFSSFFHLWPPLHPDLILADGQDVGDTTFKKEPIMATFISVLQALVHLADLVGAVHRNQDALASLFKSAGALLDRGRLRFRGTIYPIPEEAF